MRLYIEDVELDLLPDASVTLRERSPLLSDAPVAPAYSYQFNVPATYRNAQALAYSHRTAVDRVPREFLARLELPGRVLEGRVKVDEVTRDSYRVRFNYQSPFARYVREHNLREVPIRIEPSARYNGEDYLLSDFIYYIIDVKTTTIDITLGGQVFSATGGSLEATARKLASEVDASGTAVGEYLGGAFALLRQQVPDVDSTSFGLEVTTGDAEFPHYQSNSAINIAGGGIVLANMLPTSAERLAALMYKMSAPSDTFPASNVAFPPVYHPFFFSEMEDDVFALPITNNFNVEYGEYYAIRTESHFEGFSNAITPMFYVEVVVRAICNAAGYTLTGALGADKWKDLTLYSNVSLGRLEAVDPINDDYENYILNATTAQAGIGPRDNTTVRAYYGLPATSTGHKLEFDGPVDARRLLPDMSLEVLLRALRDTLGIILLVDDQRRTVEAADISALDTRQLREIAFAKVSEQYRLRRQVRDGYRYRFTLPLEIHETRVTPYRRPPQIDHETLLFYELLTNIKPDGEVTYHHAEGRYYQYASGAPQYGAHEMLAVDESETVPNPYAGHQFTPQPPGDIVEIESTGTVLPLRFGLPSVVYDARRNQIADSALGSSADLTIDLDVERMLLNETFTIDLGNGQSSQFVFSDNPGPEQTGIYFLNATQKDQAWHDTHFNPDFTSDPALSGAFDVLLDTIWIGGDPPIIRLRLTSSQGFPNFAITSMRQGLVVSVSGPKGTVVDRRSETGARPMDALGPSPENPIEDTYFPFLISENEGPGALISRPTTDERVIDVPVFMWYYWDAEMNYSAGAFQESVIESPYKMPLGSYHTYDANGNEIGGITIRPLNLHRNELAVLLRIQTRYQELERDFRPDELPPEAKGVWQIEGVRYYADYIEYTVRPRGIVRQRLHGRKVL